MSDLPPKLKTFWVSWHMPSKLLPMFELCYPWWIRGSYLNREGCEMDVLCASVKALNHDEAEEIIFRSYDIRPEKIHFRFCAEREDGWTPFNEEFPKAEWMEWE